MSYPQQPSWQPTGQGHGASQSQGHQGQGVPQGQSTQWQGAQWPQSSTSGTYWQQGSGQQPQGSSYGFAQQGFPTQGGWPQSGSAGTPAGQWPAPQAPAPQPGVPQPGTGRPVVPVVRPARKRNPLAMVLLGMIALAVVAIGVLVVVGMVNSGGSQVRFVNEDYTPPPPDLDPPPLPMPASVTEAAEWTSENPLYLQKMPTPIRCDLSPLDYTTASTADIEEHMNTLSGCLTGAWVVPMEAAGFVMPRPSVTVYTGGSTVKTPCGELPDRNAVYCGANQQIYYSDNLNSAFAELQESRYGPELIMAHEFGHAIQGRSGISMSRTLLMRNASTEAEAYGLNRRLEAQADCFSGLFLRSSSLALGIEQTDVSDFEAILEAIGGSKPGKTHPMGSSRLFWGTTGMSTDDIGKCNTYVAPESTIR